MTVTVRLTFTRARRPPEVYEAPHECADPADVNPLVLEHRRASGITWHRFALDRRDGSVAIYQPVPARDARSLIPKLERFGFRRVEI